MKEITKALNKAQAVMTGAQQDKNNPHYKSTYSSLNAVFEAIKEPFAENGLAVSQPIEITETGRMVLVTKLMHVSGEMIESKMLLPNIDAPQKIGAALSYYRRYSLLAICGLPTLDDDGEEAEKGVKQAPQRLSAQQATWVGQCIQGDSALLNKVLETYAVTSISEIPASCWNDVKSRMEAHIKGATA
jgi:hypothetical protein